MSNPVHVESIRDFVLQKPERPITEVRVYAKSIGATEADIHRALEEVSGFLLTGHSLNQQFEEEELELSNRFRKYGWIGIVLSFIFVGAGILFFHPTPEAVVSLQPVHTSVVNQTKSVMKTPVYAQQEISSSEGNLHK